MTSPRVRDLCGLYCVTEFANYEQAEFFMYLIGTGVSRSRYELTAHDRNTHALLFVVQVDASAQALAARAGKAGSNSDAQAVAATLDQARRIVETRAYEQGKRFQLRLEADAAILDRLA